MERRLVAPRIASAPETASFLKAQRSLGHLHGGRDAIQQTEAIRYKALSCAHPTCGRLCSVAGQLANVPQVAFEGRWHLATVGHRG
jgi:hypothetical protein